MSADLLKDDAENARDDHRRAVHHSMVPDGESIDEAPENQVAGATPGWC